MWPDVKRYHWKVFPPQMIFSWFWDPLSQKKSHPFSRVWRRIRAPCPRVIPLKWQQGETRVSPHSQRANVIKTRATRGLSTSLCSYCFSRVWMWHTHTHTIISLFRMQFSTQYQSVTSPNPYVWFNSMIREHSDPKLCMFTSLGLWLMAAGVSQAWQCINTHTRAHKGQHCIQYAAELSAPFQ